MTVTVTWSEAVNVDVTLAVPPYTGSQPPHLHLRYGWFAAPTAEADYTSGTGTTSTVFTATVEDRRDAPYSRIDVYYESLSTEIWDATPGQDPVGSYITSVSTGKPAILGHGLYWGPESGQQVEAVSITGVPTFNDPGEDNVFGPGETVEVTLAFSQPVQVDTTEGSPSVEVLLGGTTAKQALYARGSGTGQLVFGYTLTAEDGEHNSLLVEPDSLALNGGSIRDVANMLDAAIGHQGGGTYFAPPPDETAPQLQSATVNGSSLTLAYDEELENSNGLSSSLFAVKVNQASRPVMGVAVGQTHVILLLSLAVIAGEVVTVDYTVPTDDEADRLQDTAGNAAESFSAQAVTNSTTSGAERSEPVQAPDSLNVAIHESGKLRASWNAPGSGPTPTGYTVQWKESGTGWEGQDDVSEAEVNMTSHVIRGLTDGTEYAVRVIATVDSADSAPSEEVTATPQETTPPAPSAAEVDGAGLTLTFNEALDTGETPDRSAFAVTVGDKHRGVDTVAVSGSEATLTLVTAVFAGDAVAVAYEAPTGESDARLRDLAGNAAASFSSQSVTNNTQAADPLTASVHGVPAAHDGTATFTFELRFSEEPEEEFSYKTLRDHAFTVTGGTVTKAGRLAPPSNVGWEVRVTPGGDGPVTIALPVTTDCAAPGAVCTGDRRPLSGRLELTVSGPGEAQEPPPNSQATGKPEITGTAREGETLTASRRGISDLDGLDNATFSYQWVADSSDIPGATGSTYTLVSADVGKAIRVRAGFTDDAGNDETLTSAATLAVAAIAPTAPLDLTAAPGAQPETLDVAWNAPSSDGGSDITGYTVEWKLTTGSWDTPADVSQTTVTGTGHTITGLTGDVEYTVRVLATNNAGNGPLSTDAAATPAAVPEEPPEPVNNAPTGLPTISGTPQVDQTLTASTSGIGDQDGLENVSYSHQWLADGSTLEGATGTTLLLTSSHQGKAISVRVSFSDDAGNAESLTSRNTVVVAAKPNSEPTGLPSITGTPQVGETLTADTSPIDDQDGLTNVFYRYQWIAGGSEIGGATGSTYILASDDVGKTIKVHVSFTDDRGHGEELTSPATDAVAGLPPPPLTASLENTPSSHDGESVFTFELRFSEEFGLSYKTLRDHGFTVAGGTVKKAQRLEQGSNIGWRITLQPSGNGDVTITLPETTDCDAQGAICTEDGRKLSHRLELTVGGPGQ